jgi:putative DNA primase/helicase
VTFAAKLLAANVTPLLLTEQQLTRLKEALTWHAAGYTPLPVKPDGTKSPAVRTWTQWQQRPPTLPELIDLFAVDHDGLGLVCGAVSGNLEMLELEGRAVDDGMFDQLSRAFADHDFVHLWGRVTNGYAERTPSGGVHWYYRVNGPAAGNTKLARRPSTPDELAANPGAKVQVLIETRGEGGFTVIAPSNGRTHPTGQPWTVITGAPADIPTLTEDERDAIHAIASTLDQMPTVEIPQPSGSTSLLSLAGGLRPGDDYNQRTTWKEILEPHGWRLVRHFGGNTYGWQRPGKPGPGISATTGRNEADNLYIFSTSTEHEEERPHSKFSMYAQLEHGGDYSAAAKALRAQGYGTPPPIAPTPAPVRHLHAVDGTAALAEPRIEPTHPAAYGPTEDGTARALAETQTDALRYCPQRGMWLTWTGTRWAWDTAEIHREHIRDMARRLPDGDGWAAYKKRALSSGGVTGIARLAQSDARLTVHIDDLDANPYELNTPTGIIDLRTGHQRPANPQALHTRTTTAAPDYDRESELLTRFLHTTFGGDPNLIGYIQRLIGLSLIGIVLEQILLFAYGSGANGKSTLIEAIMSVVGRNETGYSIAAPAEMLMIRKHTEHPAELAQLAGARLVICSELDDGQRFAEARIKQLTGRDSINARFMRRDPFTFTPSHTLWLIGNHKPDATAGGPAFWRRLKLVPFGHVVPEPERDIRLPEKLAEEAPAILAWIARGAALYNTHGLATPEAVTTATEAYESDQDTIGRFVAEQCHRAANDSVRVRVTHLREAYEQWCRESGDTPVSARRLTQELRDRYGVESVKGTAGQRFYVRICLLQEDNDQ